ncbi:hypothetical protein TNCV_1545451, partial [Trichonephila clavipes]
IIIDYIIFFVIHKISNIFVEKKHNSVANLFINFLYKIDVKKNSYSEMN